MAGIFCACRPVSPGACARLLRHHPAHPQLSSLKTATLQYDLHPVGLTQFDVYRGLNFATTNTLVKKVHASKAHLPVDCAMRASGDPPMRKAIDDANRLELELFPEQCIKFFHVKYTQEPKQTRARLHSFQRLEFLGMIPQLPDSCLTKVQILFIVSPSMAIDM